ncbi:PREDICTED: LOC110763563 isoform, partial [Prunus dulcis]
MDKSWMYADRRSREYEVGVEGFLKFAIENSRNVNLIHFPCIKCGNILQYGIAVIRDHMYINGVDTSYQSWIWHGEPYVSVANANEPFPSTNEQGYVSETVDMEDTDFGDSLNDPYEFLNVLGDGDKPLYPGSNVTKLTALVRLYNLKAKYGLSDSGFTDLVICFGEILPEGHHLPSS